ncbi:MAG TPA: ankyrin repeat domain-containing protein [Niabella sp.]|nr:ankyrin repeat domain-containing protein [Niabella sp.]HOZ97672.1 ankyrin repeat domain-containing protein [Niabella sp.]HQW13978.1 ankyrin repeat domain-containing protein [Niabella sp.]HQX19479.1 ankyrin repeat domain-containing protein [Niabella sp.]HQX41439.1 ankyrin repeat domain-containing protein [Niabella sp.]
MKSFFLSLFSLAVISATAQPGGGPPPPAHKNAFLNQSFWQAKPSVETIKSTIANGNNPAELNSNSFDPVVFAINSDAPAESILYLLAQKGNEVNKLTHDARTYIFWSASKGNIEIMKWLLSNGAKIDMVDSHGLSPLNFAANGGQKNIAVYDLLIKAGADLTKDVDHDGANALLLAVGGDNDLSLTQYFQSKGLDIKSTDTEGNTAFNYAARTGNIVLMKKLLDKGVKFTNNAMVMASIGTRRGFNNIEVFEYLESLGIKPSTTSQSGANALHSIVRRPGQEKLINYFLSKGTNVNQKDEEGNTVFMNAAVGSDMATLELLNKTVKDINATNEAGATALALAVKGNTPEVVAYLIDKGANLNILDAKGNNLAFYLTESYNPRTAASFEPKLKLLQTKGLNIATPQQDGNTLYHLAVTKNNLDLLKKVSAYGVDINAKNKEGVTALHKAAMLSKTDDMLRFLISLGAAKEIKTEFDETAFDLATENGFLKKEKISIDFLK